MKKFNALYGTFAVAALALVSIGANAGDMDEPCKDPDSQKVTAVKVAGDTSARHDDSAAPAMGGEGDGAIGGNAPNPDPDRSAQTVMDDAAITAKVKSSLLADTTVSGLKIDVDTRSGVVYLTGDNMESQSAIDQAMKLAMATDGVTRVVSKLAVGDIKN